MTYRFAGGSLILNHSASDNLRGLLSKPGALLAPGVFLPITAVMAERLGFKLLYLSGAAFSNSLGLPDLGVTTLTEVIEEARRITSLTRLPLIIDADTGFGEALNVARTVKMAESVNAAAIQIEDQVMPKKCGHLPEKQVVQVEEMVKKIIAAKRASKQNIVLIARTDARAVEGLDSAIYRAKLYMKAGADVIFPEALESEDEFIEFSKKLHAPLLANMTEFGKTPYISFRRFEEMGYKIVIFPVTALRASLKTVKEVFQELLEKGTQKGILSRLMTREEIYDIINYYSYEEEDKKVKEEADGLLSNTDTIKRG